MFESINHHQDSDENAPKTKEIHTIKVTINLLIIYYTATLETMKEIRKNPLNNSKMLTFAIVLVQLLLASTKTTMVSATFQWDQDTLDDCEARALSGQCTLDDTTFYQCPKTCKKGIESPGDRTQGEVEDGHEDELFELSTPLPGNKMLEWDRFEGYVTLVAVIPLLPGMAQYYYDMMEHLHTIWPYTLEIVVFPVRLKEDPENHPPVQLKIPDKSKIVVTKELKVADMNTIESNPILEYIEEAINPGSGFLLTDRVTTYIISFNAKFIEKDASPSLDFLERLVTHHLQAYEWKGAEM